MERIKLPLSSLSTAQKIDIMETVWDSLAKSDESMDSPAWHAAILENRETALSNGTISVSDWEEAKERIKRNVACK